VETEIEKTEIRNCANCACSFFREHETNPMEKQMFCKRNGPQVAQMRTEKPRLRDGKVVIDRRTQKPEMENVMTIVYVYAPTMPDLVCFDGWRALGVLPGTN
jgi:hypothetical protein